MKKQSKKFAIIENLIHWFKTHVTATIIIGVLGLVLSAASLWLKFTEDPKELSNQLLYFIGEYQRTQIPDIPEILSEDPHILQTKNNIQRVDIIVNDWHTFANHIQNNDWLPESVLREFAVIDARQKDALKNDLSKHMAGLGLLVLQEDTLIFSEFEFRRLMDFAPDDEIKELLNLHENITAKFKYTDAALQDILNKQAKHAITQEMAKEKAYKIVKSTLKSKEFNAYVDVSMRCLLKLKQYYIEYINMRIIHQDKRVKLQ